MCQYLDYESLMKEENKNEIEKIVQEIREIHFLELKKNARPQIKEFTVGQTKERKNKKEYIDKLLQNVRLSCTIVNFKSFQMERKVTYKRAN